MKIVIRCLPLFLYMYVFSSWNFIVGVFVFIFVFGLHSLVKICNREMLVEGRGLINLMSLIWTCGWCAFSMLI